MKEWVEVFVERSFEAAHRLPKLSPEHKCHRLHNVAARKPGRFSPWRNCGARGLAKLFLDIDGSFQ